MNEEKDALEVGLAEYSDRIAAFSIDFGLFAAFYFLTLKAIAPDLPIRVNPHGLNMALLWTGLFFAYHAVFSSDGRTTLGKNLLGIRIVSSDGETLSVLGAGLRSFGYLLSSVFGAGFLWIIANPRKQTLHDLLLGSIVVELEPKSALHRLGVRALATACIGAFCLVWFWQVLLGPRYHDTMTVAYAKVGLEEVETLQRIHYIKHDRFAGSLGELAKVSGDPSTFMADMANLFAQKDGVDIELKSDGYILTAVARDRHKTPVRHAGPREPIASRRGPNS